MNNSKKHSTWGSPTLSALALIALGCVLPAAHAAPPAYTVIDLGVLPGEYSSEGRAVNDSGQVAGDSGNRAFLSGPNGGPLKDLGTLGGSISDTNYSVGYGVNASGQVAGMSPVSVSTSARAFGTGQPALRLAVFRLASVAPANYQHAFLSGPNGGPLRDLGTLPGATDSQGLAVNDSGQVTGYSGGHAFLSGPNGGPLKDLGTLPGGNFSFGIAVNASGQVAAQADAPSAGDYEHAVLSGPNGGPFKDLGSLSGHPVSLASDVNASGQVVGTAYLYQDDAMGNSSPAMQRAFLSGPNGGPLQDLGTLPGRITSLGYGVNDSGQVVGESSTAANAYEFINDTAFLYSGGVMTDLNTLVAPGSGVVLTAANHISNNGFISATGTTASGASHAFLLTPIVVNSGPKITPTASASALSATGQRTIAVTTTNSGGAAADRLQITSVTLGTAAPAPAPISPSPVPTTPNLLSNKPGMNTQTNAFVFTPVAGTTRGVLYVSGTYVDSHHVKGSFNGTIRLIFP